MSSIIISLLIGATAGVLDVLPMFLQRLDKFACISAFVHWVVLGLIISHIDIGLAPWLTGVVVAVLTAIPIMVIVYPQDSKAIIPMLISSIILGALVGIVGTKFIG